MSLKHLIVTLVAGMTMSVCSTLFAQTAADEAAAAQEYKRMKMDEATAADDKFHANRTQANMVARDKAEAEAAEAIKNAQAAMDRASTAAESEAKAGNPQ